jgi:SAM-dependent methyltransferase
MSSIYDEDAIIESFKTSQCDKSLRATAQKLVSKDGANYYRILDIGCGLAPLLPYLKELIGSNPFSYRGIDASQAMIEEATRLHCCNGGDIKFRVEDATSLHDGEQLEWNNVVIVRDVIDLLVDVTALCDAISNALTNDGVFYISTRLDSKIISHVSDDFYVVEDEGGSCRRRLFTRESFDKWVVSRFKRERAYNLHVFESTDDNGRRSLNLFGYKGTLQHFAKYHYAFGYDPALTSLKDLLALYTDQVTHFGDSARTFRHEGYLKAMNEEHFGTMMNVLYNAVNKIRPGKYPIYLKDKLNIQHWGARFSLHQDATAGWNERIGPFEFVTFGLPLEPVLDASYGGTRIVIRQNYTPSLIDGSENIAINPDDYSSAIGRTIQYLNCVAMPGTYYAYDQYVLHDSSANLQNRERSVLFVTCILSDYDDIYSRALSRQFAHLLETRPGLDTVRHGRRAG